ncbi:glycosyltransferase family 39 protein [Persicitalea sp.]|uniref:glycosyltransferase family 39 protein n=1 Tax=Persicitalea sp. TaxID=3100273 RepID=UPI003593C21C
MKFPPKYLFISIVVLAFALRVYKSGSYGIFLDEKYTMVISQGVVMEGANQKDVFFTPGKKYFTPREFWKEKNFGDFIEANIRGDIGNSPAYYGVFWVWTKLFGLSDFAVRFLSVIFSTLIVALLYVFVMRHFQSEPLALLSAFLAAIEPFFVAYSHQARNYSMSFFLTLLATHLFLLIIEYYQRESSPSKIPLRLYLFYGLVFVTSLLSHYLTLTVFLCHGLYALFFLRPVKRWVPFVLTAVVGVGLVSLWFIFGGGKYTFQTLAYQAKLYGELAQTHPYDNPFAIILPATLTNVGIKSSPIWADLLMFSNGLGQIDTLGIRNMALALAFGLGATWLLHSYLKGSNRPLWLVAIFGLLLVAAMPLYTVPRLQYVVLAAFPAFIYLWVLYLRTTDTKTSLLWFTGILAVVPTLFLVVMSFKNNHTYGLTQRYSGFSFPYSIIFVAMMLRELLRIPKPMQLVLGVVLGIQAYFIGNLLIRIYQDRDPKYTYFVNPRGPNPYMLTAEKIIENYAPGDTVLYPSVKLNPRDEIERTHSPYAIQDAQLTNLYLPKDAEYYQRMDTTQTDKVLLIKGNTGERVVIFDFQGQKYRY